MQFCSLLQTSKAKLNPYSKIDPEAINHLTKKSNNSKWLFEFDKIKLTDSFLIWQLD